MSLQITSTGGSPFKVMADNVEVSSHSTWHKAVQSAVNTEYADPASDVRIVRTAEFRVEAPIPDPEQPPPDDPGPIPPEPEPEPPPPDPEPEPPVPPAEGAYDDAWFATQKAAFIQKASNLPSIQSATNYDTYYDVAVGHYELFDETGDSNFKSEAERVLALYLSRYGSGGAKPGYWRFSQGARMSLERADGVASMANLRHLRDGHAFSKSWEFRWDNASAPHGLSGFWHTISREMSYTLMAQLDCEKQGDPRDEQSSYAGGNRPLVEELVEMSEAHFHQFVDQTGSRTSPFMVGISMRALIQYYEWELANGRTPYWPTQSLGHTAKDADNNPVLRWPDLPSMIEDVCQKLTVMQTRDGSADIYRENGDEAGFQYEDHTSTGLAYDLNMLIAPAYEWAYQNGPSNDPMLRNVADRLFKGAVNNAYTGSGKQWGQFTIWGFDQIRMRRGA